MLRNLCLDHSQVAAELDYLEFKQNDTLCLQGESQNMAFFVAKGTIQREKQVGEVTHKVVLFHFCFLMYS